MNLENEYLNWLLDLVGCKRRPKSLSHTRLLTYLHNTEFRYLLSMDENRASDGIDFRQRFIDNSKLYFPEPCSVLEMIVALASRCENEIMTDDSYGNRMRYWFWGMINNLGLGDMTDENYDPVYVRDTVDRFLDREYEPNGEGGLFTIDDCDEDLRDIEIWYQLNWYLAKYI